MSYIDDRMKILLKKQAKVLKESHLASANRQTAHNDIQKALAQAILKGSFLSQEVWILPSNWAHSVQQNNFELIVTTPVKQLKGKWGSILTYMEEYCYSVPLSSGISLTFREDGGFELAADDNEKLSNFVKKHGLQIVCPDVDGITETLNDKLDFIKRIRSSFKIP